MDDITLLSVPMGGTAVVAGIKQGGSTRRRLMELGITPGEGIQCLFSAPSGSPRAYLVRGAVIALRSSDARMVMMRA